MNSNNDATEDARRAAARPAFDQEPDMTWAQKLEAHAKYINQYADGSDFLVDVVGSHDEARLRLRDTFLQSSVDDVTSIRWELMEAVDKFHTNPYDAIRLAHADGWVI